MLVYRIAKTEARCHDLTGIGAFKFGGRWNSVGTYMLYTSENSSLAYLENLVHFEPENYPPSLYIATLELKVDLLNVRELLLNEYPSDWQTIGNANIRSIGDGFIKSRNSIALKVKSAINTSEHNYLLNPLFAGYHNLVSVKNIEKLNVDIRLIR